MAADGTVVWQITLGGDQRDQARDIVQTSDGGFLVVGLSNSGISGNKTTATNGLYDVWLVKLNATGQIVWQKNYGGTNNDAGQRIIELNNGNYLIAGNSDSDVSGNKTVPSNGSTDFWTLTIDDLGNVVNQNAYGGSGKDNCYDIQKLGASELVLIGYSDSDISGDKLQNSYGGRDIWVVSTDYNGVISHSSTEGGTGTDRGMALGIHNNKMVLFGSSDSDISGSKSQPSFGIDDLWAVNLNSNHTRNWEAVFGGDQSEAISFDAGGTYCNALNQYIIAGSSLSDISGNKTLPAFDIGFGDLWIAGMDTNGVKQFDFVTGGDRAERYKSILESNNGTILVAGTSLSGVSGNKTDETNGLSDIWIVELDFNLSVQKVTAANNLEVYPNPSTTMLNFSIPMAVNQSSIALTDLSGKVVYQESIGMTQNHQIDVTHLAKGMYILSVKADTFYYTHQVVIE